jgi:8-amino-7-oxononanoate synthase
VSGSRGVVDFTSSLFLGWRHSAGSLPPWSSLTTGIPAVLSEPVVAQRVAAAVAATHGAPAGVVARSTLHALTDILGVLPGPGDVVAIDSAGYPITRLAALVAAAKGATVRTYPHHRPDRLCAPPGRRLFVVTDGWCPGCNRPGPAFLDGATLIVDDTLAFGLLGGARWTGGVVRVASLAKAYGAPLAVVTGSREVIARLRRDGGNRMHSSPPPAADLAAALTALGDTRGNRLRRERLWTNVSGVRSALRGMGFRLVGRPFPLVSIDMPSPAEAYRWWRRLSGRGVRSVVQHPLCRPGVVLSLLVRADHTERDLEALLDGLGRAAA